MTSFEKAASVAEAQGGHITWAQLMTCGLSRNQVGRRCRTHGWVRVLPRIYRVGGVRDSFESRLDAVTLWLGDDGYFCSATAAFLLGLEGVSRPNRIVVARASVPSVPPWLKVVRFNGEPARPRLIRGRRIAPVERVLLDLAGEIPALNLGRALDDSLRRGLTTIARLDSFLRTSQGRKGAGVLRRMLRTRDLRDEKVRTEFETRMLAILRRIDSPVDADHEVIVRRERFVLDFYFPEVLLGVECHSLKWHLGHEAFKNDVRRHRLIASTGIELLFFTWDEVTSSPARVEAEIQGAIERRRLRLFST